MRHPSYLPLILILLVLIIAFGVTIWRFILVPEVREQVDPTPTPALIVLPASPAPTGTPTLPAVTREPLIEQTPLTREPTLTSTATVAVVPATPTVERSPVQRG